MKIKKKLNILRHSLAFVAGVLITAPILYSFTKQPYSPPPVTRTATMATTAAAINDCLSQLGNVNGIKLYSQNDEDGALLQTLRCMGGHGTKEYFEFGSETGIEVNTRILRELYGWHGHLLDGGNENPDIALHKEYFTPSNIVSLLEKYKVSKDLDVLSVDCDYDDLFVTREILVGGYRPRVLIVEYNSNLGHELEVSAVPKPVGKERSVHWGGDCYFGASSPAIIRLVGAFGYTPVWSNNVNLMFVQKSQAKELGMIIPSLDRFPPVLKNGTIHSDCKGLFWVKFNPGVMETLATDPTVTHEAFAKSFPVVKLTYDSYDNEFSSWRIFREEEETD